MRTVTVIRNNGWYGQFRSARIMADRREIGRVSAGKSVQVQVPDDAANLFVKMDWGRSRPFPVRDLKPVDTIYMNARFTMNPLSGLGITAIPISLDRSPVFSVGDTDASVFE